MGEEGVITMMTVRQAAAELCVSVQTVYGLCKRKQLRHERHGLSGGKILIPEDAIEEYRRSVTVGVRREATAPPTPRPKLKHLALSEPRRAGGPAAASGANNGG
jgi:excisionase family DNA binding protein